MRSLIIQVTSSDAEEDVPSELLKIGYGAAIQNLATKPMTILYLFVFNS